MVPEAILEKLEPMAMNARPAVFIVKIQQHRV